MYVACGPFLCLSAKTVGVRTEGVFDLVPAPAWAHMNQHSSDESFTRHANECASETMAPGPNNLHRGPSSTARGVVGRFRCSGVCVRACVNVRRARARSRLCVCVSCGCVLRLAGYLIGWWWSRRLLELPSSLAVMNVNPWNFLHTRTHTCACPNAKIRRY